MAAGLGGLFADAFPEVPTLDEIEVGFTFSKKDAAHLAASIDVPAIPLVEAVASSGLKADVITNILSLIGTAYATFLSGLSVTLPVAATSPTSDSNAQFHGDSLGSRPVSQPLGCGLFLRTLSAPR